MNGSQTDAIVGALRTLHLRKMKARADGPYVAARRAMNAYEALLARFSRGLDALLPPQELEPVRRPGVGGGPPRARSKAAHTTEERPHIPRG